MTTSSTAKIYHSPACETSRNTLALMQVSGGSQSFNSLNQMCILGRWMRMITISNQAQFQKLF